MGIIDGVIVYAATPFRFTDEKIEKICDFVERTGNFPFHPLKAMPLKRYNYARYSPRIIFEACFRCVDFVGDEVWIFGLGTGSLREYQRARNLGKPVRSFVKRFDDKWEEFVERYQKKFGGIVEGVLQTSE